MEKTYKCLYGQTHERTRFATQRMTILTVEGISPTFEPTHETRENIITFQELDIPLSNDIVALYLKLKKDPQTIKP